MVKKVADPCYNYESIFKSIRNRYYTNLYDYSDVFYTFLFRLNFFVPDHSSRCYCKNFNSFNINDNKIFTSKIKHFAFNNNAKKVRQKLLLRKHLEANILNMLITKEHKNIIQSREHNIPIFNSISINKKFEKFDFKENDHIEPSILSMLKDVYVDVEYLTEYCDYNTSGNILNSNNFNTNYCNIIVFRS